MPCNCSRMSGESTARSRWSACGRSRSALLESDADEPVVLLAELIRTDLRCRFARGQSPAVADYLGTFPELREADSRVLSLIYEEFCLGEERGDAVDVVVVLRPLSPVEGIAGLPAPVSSPLQPGGRRTSQGPPVSGAGRHVRGIPARLAAGTGRDVARLPGPGPLAGGEAGRPQGLARSRAQSRRPRARWTIRTSSRSTRSSSTTARCAASRCRTARGCRWTRSSGGSIRPRGRGTRWPYGKPWSGRRRARRAGPDAVADPARRGPRRRGPGATAGRVSRSGAPMLRAWPGSSRSIAEALHYAHGQQTFHRDVKPANVLLTIQHGPQLLDFNLAESPHSASQAQAAMHGGTLPYMAPEQIEAFLDPELWGKVGARADIYSLGLVLRELLTGQAPDLPGRDALAAPRHARAARPPAAARRLGATDEPGDPSCPRGDRRQVPGGPARAALSRRRRPGRRPGPIPPPPPAGPRQSIRHDRSDARTGACDNRMRLAVVAACLAPLWLAVGLAWRTDTRVRPSTPFRSSPVLIDALKNLDGHARDAIEPLKLLVSQYPDSCLPLVALCLAHDASEQDETANLASARR